MKNKFTAIFMICLIAFTVYISLDTFVISSAYQKEATDERWMGDESSAQVESASNYIASSNSNESGILNDDLKGSEDNSGDTTNDLLKDNNLEPESEDNINIELAEYTVNNTAVYVADVKLSSAKYLKTAFADGTYGKNVTDKTSVIAEENNALLAINGDYYGARERGYVIRNGVLYRDTSDDEEVLAIYPDGSFKVVNPSEISAEELVEDGVWQAFSFGPGLVEDGEIAVTVNEETGRAKASNPRTAIGIIENLHYIFVVSDGRTDESEGLSLYELAGFMKDLGATTAYNLDGGGSSTMVYQGEVINNPTSSGNTIKERKVSDIIYIGE